MALTPVTAMYADAVRSNALFNESARQQAAFNALRRTYGDIAGDPGAALQLQEYGYNEQANPLRLEDMRIQNALSRQSYDFNEEYNPLRIEAAQLDNRGQRVEVSDAEATQKRKAFVDGARYVKRRLEEGADPGTAFDEISPHLPATPEQLTQIRETIVSNPDEIDTFLETFGSDDTVDAGLKPIFLRDSEGRVVPGQLTKDGRVIPSQMPSGFELAPDPTYRDLGDREIIFDRDGRPIGVVEKGGTPSADQRPVNPGIQPVPAQGAAPGLRGPLGPSGESGGQAAPERGLEPIPGSKLDRETRQEQQEEEDRRLSEETLAGAVAAPVLRTINRSLDEYMPAMAQGDSVLSAGQRFARQYIPGTAEWNFATEILTPLANISLERLNQMRKNSATGASGLGQVTQSEHELLQQSLGAIDVTLPPAVLRENLRQLHNTFLDIIYGSAEERARLVEQGRLDPELNEQVSKQYFTTEFDQFGDRRSDEDSGLSGASDDELIQRVFGGE